MDILKQLSDVLECSICAEIYTCPKILPCLHTFCLKCLEVCAKHVLLDDGKICCPLCRDKSVRKESIPKLPDNQVFIYLTHVKEKILSYLSKYKCAKCSHKTCQATEIWHCTVCDVGFCDTCLQSHEKLHKVIKLSVLLQGNIMVFVQSCLNQMKRQLKSGAKAFGESVGAAEYDIRKNAEDFKCLIDQHKEKLLEELEQKQIKKQQQYDTLQQAIENLLLSSSSSCGFSSIDKTHVDAIKPGDARPERTKDMPLLISSKFCDSFCSTSDVRFVPRNMHEELLSFSSASNILGQLSFSEENSEEKQLISIVEKIESKVLTLETKRNGVIVGLSSIRDKVYVVHSLASCIDEYDYKKFMLIRSLEVAGLSSPQDMASCERLECMYVADSYDDTIHRVGVNGETVKWSVGDQPLGVSVSNHNAHVFVTCLYSQRLYEFTSSGVIVQCIFLQPDLTHPHHAVHASNGDIVLSHGYWSTDPLHRVCLIDTLNGHSLRCFGEEPGSAPGRLNQPLHLAALNNGLILIADSDNSRIQVLSSSLINVACFTDSIGHLKSPHRLCVDTRRGLLYVAENTLQSRIFVFILNNLLTRNVI